MEVILLGKKKKDLTLKRKGKIGSHLLVHRRRQAA